MKYLSKDNIIIKTTNKKIILFEANIIVLFVNKEFLELMINFCKCEVINILLHILVILHKVVTFNYGNVFLKILCF